MGNDNPPQFRVELDQLGEDKVPPQGNCLIITARRFTLNDGGAHRSSLGCDRPNRGPIELISGSLEKSALIDLRKP
jgi:hypothetical protein